VSSEEWNGFQFPKHCVLLEHEVSRDECKETQGPGSLCFVRGYRKLGGLQKKIFNFYIPGRQKRINFEKVCYYAQNIAEGYYLTFYFQHISKLIKLLQ
jgi:hypothetical protein